MSNTVATADRFLLIVQNNVSYLTICMCVCVCVCVCLHVCVDACLIVCMHVCVCVQTLAVSFHPALDCIVLHNFLHILR